MSSPNNFSWVNDNVAGFAFPHTLENIKFLVEENDIRHIITMCEDKPDLGDYSKRCQNHHFPLPDNTAAVEVIEKAIRVILDAEKKGEKSGVHCHYGQGRAGTVLACYLGQKEQMNGDLAIETVRSMRPGSVTSRSQITAIKEFLKEN